MAGGFIPAVKQIANVAALPGIVGASLGMPDIHSGYGFSIGNVAAFDMNDPNAIVSPGGVGFDINCGVRLVRTNLHWDDVKNKQEELSQVLHEEKLQTLFARTHDILIHFSGAFRSYSCWCWLKRNHSDPNEGFGGSTGNGP